MFERLVHCVFNVVSWLMDLLTSLFLSFQSNGTVPFVRMNVLVLKTLLRSGVGLPRYMENCHKYSKRAATVAVRQEGEGRGGCCGAVFRRRNE